MRNDNPTPGPSPLAERGEQPRLTAREVKILRFAELVALGTDQQEAAAQAGYKRGAGLAVTASRLMLDPAVQAHLKKLREAQEADAVAQIAEIKRELTADIRADLGDAVADGALDLDAIKKLGRRVKAISITPGKFGDSIRVEVADKHSAIGLLGKMEGWFKPEKTEVKHSVDDKKFPPGFLAFAAEQLNGAAEQNGGKAEGGKQEPATA